MILSETKQDGDPKDVEGEVYDNGPDTKLESGEISHISDSHNGFFTTTQSGLVLGSEAFEFVNDQWVLKASAGAGCIIAPDSTHPDTGSFTEYVNGGGSGYEALSAKYAGSLLCLQFWNVDQKESPNNAGRPASTASGPGYSPASATQQHHRDDGLSGTPALDEWNGLK
jgi:hypothetical protein